MSSSDGRHSKRLLFASYHCHVDPSSGAAVSVRELLALLSTRGWEIRTFCGPRLDFVRHQDIRQILADERLTVHETTGTFENHSFSLLSFREGAIRSSVFLPSAASKEHATGEGGRGFVACYQHMLAAWRPDVLVTYGGDRIAELMLRQTRQRGVPIVFWLHNLAYQDIHLFETVDQVIVPSEYSATYYRKAIDLKCLVLGTAGRIARGFNGFVARVFV